MYSNSKYSLSSKGGIYYARQNRKDARKTAERRKGFIFMDREQAKQEIRASWRTLITGIAQQAKAKANGEASYICPFCGHGTHGDGLTRNPKSTDGNGLKCFGCDFSGDIIELYQKKNGTDYNETLKELAGQLNITIDKAEAPRDPRATKPKQQTTPKQATPTEDYMSYYKQAQANRSETAVQDYLKKRGISEEVAAKYWLGYDAAYQTFNKDENGQISFATWRALIIPTGKGSYIARNIDTPAEPAKKNRYRKKGASIIFNSKALYNAEKPVFIVEGEIDALSIIEAGGQAVGLGSTSNVRQLVQIIEKQAPTKTLILALDQDEDGQKAEAELASLLTGFGIPYYKYNITGAAKDANEALTLDRQSFIDRVQEAEQAEQAELEAVAEATREEYLKTSAANAVQDFFNGVVENINTPAISTGFKNLDNILDGGLYEGLYILGAISSLGKTTLALQLADNLATQGKDVLIFSLEMSRFELIAKSISRHTYLLAENKAHAKTVRGITTGARYVNYNSQEKALINKAADAYKKYADHIYIHEGIGDIGVEKVRAVVEQHKEITGNVPVIIIDYVQILAPYNERCSDKQNTDKAVLELKRLSRDYKMTVFGISSFNRDSYKSGGGVNNGRVSMTDFKESGAVEYSADVLMGLEFIGAGSKDYDEKTEKQKNPREIRLVVLKNRNGKAWETANFNYHPLFNYYSEWEAPFLPAKDKNVFSGLEGKEK